MNAGPARTLRRAARAALPFLLCLVLVLIAALPFSIPHLGPVTPQLALMGVFYWCIYRPDHLPPYAVFAVGIVHDGLAGGPFGLTALLLLLVYAFIVPQRRVFHGKGFAVGWFGFALVAVGVGALHWLAASLYYVTPMPPEPVLGQAGLSIAIYPCVAWTISRVHRLTRPDAAAAG